ncbi:MAG TPA: LysR family transcriptional regulator [Saccharospirillum sp.]|nr:LysR family transcriptional regulator [Saccharospirillum sp.]
MELRRLRYFLATYETGSVSGASRRCFVAQPSISAAIGQLEEELGSVLFERHSKGVRPTDAGERLYPLAAHLVADSEAIVQTFNQTTRSQPLCLGLMRSLGAERMSLWLKRVMARMVNLELTLVNPEEACDARVVTKAMCLPHESFEPIWRDRYCLALMAGHPLTLRERIQLQDLEGEAFILRSHCEATEQLRQTLHRLDIGIQTRAHIRTIEYSLALVSAGVGVALVPDWPENRQRPDMELRSIEGWEAELVIGLAYPEELSEVQRAALVGVCREMYTG